MWINDTKHLKNIYTPYPSVAPKRLNQSPNILFRIKLCQSQAGFQNGLNKKIPNINIGIVLPEY